jgi:phenylpropionate dioxygenase-like ring-hydroxylating dioxygenase large terminal subunit
MIPNQWYALLESREVKSGRPVGVKRLGERLVFWRDSQGQVICLADRCVHRGAALSAGRIRGDQIVCPFHGLEYSSTGRCVLIPANGRGALVPETFRVQAYPTREAYGFIWVWWGEASEQLPALPFFADLDGLSYATYRDPWPVHYSRAIENQLDVVHLPFVHDSTIGRGNRALVDGPIARLENDRISVWVHNRVDDGSRPLRAEELPDPTNSRFWLDFRFPNLWQNHISDHLRIVIAFAPVDDRNTILYIRFYQKYVRLLLLRELVNWLGVRGSLIVAHQDRRVVSTQRPRKSALRMGDKLISGDRPIVLYRRRRQELIEQAGKK